MKIRVVVFSPEAKEDLFRLYDYIAAAADPRTSIAYVERLKNHCLSLSAASERGQSRDDIRPGLRVTGFGRRVTIALSVDSDRVTILRLFYGGRNWEQDI